MKTFIPHTALQEVVLNIYKGETTCNNIDVFVKSTTGKEKIAFFDEDTMAQITPFYFGVYKNDIIIKLVGTTATNISMKIYIPSDSQVEGVVVNPNRAFMK